MPDRLQIEAEAADFADRFRAARKEAEDDERRKTPPRWLLDKWADEKLHGKRR